MRNSHCLPYILDGTAVGTEVVCTLQYIRVHEQKIRTAICRTYRPYVIITLLAASHQSSSHSQNIERTTNTTQRCHQTF